MSIKRYIFCIDTDSYAGNFDRLLTAWITGQVGDCEVGAEEARQACHQIPVKVLDWLNDHVVSRPNDEDGCLRPCAIQPTPGWFNDGMGNEYQTNSADDAIVLKIYRKSIQDYYQPHIEHAKEEIAKGNIQWRTELKKYQAEVYKVNKATKINLYPAYRSVGIFLNARPPAEVVAVLKERTHSFKDCQTDRSQYVEPFRITKFRLVTETTTETEETL